MKTVLLHIGLPKTATTVIQDCLFSAPEALTDKGVHYVRSGADVFDDSGHHVLVQAVLGFERGQRLSTATTKDGMERAWSDVVREMNDNPAPVQVISSELFCFALTEMRDLRGLQRELAGFDVRVVLVLREVASFMDSVYAQRVKDGASSLPGEFATHIWHNLNWRKMTEKWAHVFGRANMRVLKFEDLQKNGQLVDNFLRAAADLDIETPIFAPKTGNAALPYYAQQFIRELNASELDGQDKWIFRDRIRAFFDTHAHRAAQGSFRKAQFLSDDAKALLRRNCDWPDLDDV